MTEKEIISNYMRELGKKGGRANLKKGSQYFSQIAKLPRKKRSEKKE